MSLKNGITTEGFDYLYKLINLNEIIIGSYDNRKVFNDINLFPNGVYFVYIVDSKKNGKMYKFVLFR
jgi:hypothetical protein